jgi:glutathione S-transferase
MKLYLKPGACSLAPHIVLRELGLPFEFERVDTLSKKTTSGADYLAINPDGYVPALVLDDGSLLTEVVAITQYLADKVPQKKLAPEWGTMERYRLIEILNFITTELHKSYAPLFWPKLSDDAKSVFRDRLANRYKRVERTLSQTPFLLGENFTIADAYLFTITRWADRVQLDLSHCPSLAAFMLRVGERPAVVDAIAAEKQSH